MDSTRLQFDAAQAYVRHPTLGTGSWKITTRISHKRELGAAVTFDTSVGTITTKAARKDKSYRCHLRNVETARGQLLI